MQVDIVREKLGTAKIVSTKVEPDILALRLPSLDPGRADEIRSRLLDAEKQGIHKVILDVRNCGRGPVSEAIAVARLFVPSGTLSTLRGQTVSAQVFSADPGKLIWKGPVSVLIDPTTSGAAEVLASAMVANHRGDVVGERTFGLASEQKLITLDDGSALFLTVANYYNADGKSILEEGVLPSEVVRASADDDADSGDDDSAASDAQKEPVPPRPLSPEDPIFRKALDLLKSAAEKSRLAFRGRSPRNNKSVFFAPSLAGVGWFAPQPHSPFSLQWPCYLRAARASSKNVFPPAKSTPSLAK